MADDPRRTMDNGQRTTDNGQRTTDNGPMEYLWSPWRYKYVASADDDTGCVFCRVQQRGSDRENFVIYRASLNFVILNLFPYTSGHLMIVPYEHTASLASVGEP